MTDLEPVPMNTSQIRHLEDARELWGRYDFLASLQETFRGAMGWKKVGPAEDLTSYWTDPVTGKKHMGSLGRRSPETEKTKADFDAGVVAAEADAFAVLGHPINLGSPKQLQEILFGERGLPPTKKIKTGYTTDAEALQSLFAQTEDPLLAELLRWRDVSKLRQTVTGLLASVADDGRIHTTFNQIVAATGRLSSQDPNLQNIPIRTDEGRRIRSGFVVGPGYEALLTADYSQIEMRLMAHLSEDEGLIEAFRSGEDLHSYVASRVFGVPTDEVTPEQRRKIKAMSYGLALSLIHISEPTRLLSNSYAVFCLNKNTKTT